MRTCVQEEVFWPWKSNYSRSFPWGVITCPCRTHGLGRLPPFRYFHDISPLANTGYLVHVVNITFIFENCRRISCDDTSQIWKWYLSLIFFQRVVQIINKDQIQHQTSILLHCWPFVLGIHPPAHGTVWKVYPWWRHQMDTCSAFLALCEGNSPVTGEFHWLKGQWRRALMFSLICAWTKGCANNRDTGDLRRHRTHYDVIIMFHYSGSGSHCGILLRQVCGKMGRRHCERYTYGVSKTPPPLNLAINERRYHPYTIDSIPTVLQTD